MYSRDGEEEPQYADVQQEGVEGVGEGCLCGSVQQEMKGMTG